MQVPARGAWEAGVGGRWSRRAWWQPDPGPQASGTREPGGGAPSGGEVVGVEGGGRWG